MKSIKAYGHNGQHHDHKKGMQESNQYKYEQNSKLLGGALLFCPK